MEGNERNIGEKGWENHWERATLNAILWDFPRRNIILGVLEMPCTPQKPEGAAGKNVKNPEKPNACPFPLIPIKGSLGGNERNIGEKGWENH